MLFFEPLQFQSIHKCIAVYDKVDELHILFKTINTYIYLVILLDQRSISDAPAIKMRHTDTGIPMFSTHNICRVHKNFCTLF